MHPAVELLLEKTVPERGVSTGDSFIPTDTVVIASPWVAASDRKLYGEEADQ